MPGIHATRHMLGRELQVIPKARRKEIVYSMQIHEFMKLARYSKVLIKTMSISIPIPLTYFYHIPADI